MTNPPASRKSRAFSSIENRTAFIALIVYEDGEKAYIIAPQRLKAGDTVVVNLVLDSGHREVDVPEPLRLALVGKGLWDTFESLSYSTRKEHARLVAEAKAEETRQRRIEKIIAGLSA